MCIYIINAHIKFYIYTDTDKHINVYGYGYECVTPQRRYK